MIDMISIKWIIVSKHNCVILFRCYTHQLYVLAGTGYQPQEMLTYH